MAAIHSMGRQALAVQVSARAAAAYEDSITSAVYHTPYARSLAVVGRCQANVFEQAGIEALVGAAEGFLPGGRIDILGAMRAELPGHVKTCASLSIRVRVQLIGHL